MPRSKAVMIATAASILLVFASAVLALNAGLFNAGTDNVGTLTPAAATTPAPPTTITVYLDPAATAPVPAASTDTAPATNESRQGEPAEERDEEQEGHDD